MIPLQPFTGFDIETRPLPSLVEKFADPFPDFDPELVRYGNMKDPVKRAEKLKEMRANHESERELYWKRKRERAALDPLTGEIVVIGLIDENFNRSFLDGDERATLTDFWQLFTEEGDAARKWVFWSGCGALENQFDLDFIMTRSRLRGVRIPPQVRNCRYYSGRIQCLAKEFLLYKREAYMSLSRAGDVFGLYDTEHEGPEVFRKSEHDPVTGENFHLWWDGKATEHKPEKQREFAARYLSNDLNLLGHIAHRFL